MEIILYLSIALIAISFFILVVYISRTLKEFQQTIQSLAKTIHNLEKQVQDITSETAQLLRTTNAVADDIQKKMESLNSIVQAVESVSSTVESFNQSLHHISGTITKKIENHQEKVVQVMQWGNAFLEIWEKWRERKQHNQKNEGGLLNGRK
jgi:uncharacterized protein YoxC